MFSNWPDLINGGFEMVGALFTWRNFLELHRTRELRGVYWPTTAFFSAWGLWNLLYYPALGQWASLAGGIALVAGNVAWVVLAMNLKLQETIDVCDIQRDQNDADRAQERQETLEAALGRRDDWERQQRRRGKRTA